MRMDPGLPSRVRFVDDEIPYGGDTMSLVLRCNLRLHEESESDNLRVNMIFAAVSFENELRRWCVQIQTFPGTLNVGMLKVSNVECINGMRAFTVGLRFIFVPTATSS